MSKETEAAFDDWETQGFSGDDVHNHFIDHGSRDTVAIAEEGQRLLGLLRKKTFHDQTPEAQVLYGVACQAYHGAMADVAEMFGLDAKQFERTVDYWHDESRDCKTPMQLADFVAYHKEKNKPRAR